ncbi:uncharacterized protein LOC134209979 [Armigeres subalbatus]|uniref:uncharacterized protein LOC134209979 n=1 Tax=Armigeres subalbatus TaxID=124917 RepID=UPI002ED02DA3
MRAVFPKHQLRKSLEGIQQFVASYQASRDARQVCVRLEALERVYGQSVDIRMEIELLLEDAVEKGNLQEEESLTVANDKVRQEFEDSFYSLKADLVAFKTVGSSVSVGSTSQQPASQFAKVKLPEIKLPSFSGKIHDWVPYRDSFRIMIHDNPLLSDVDRFTYLRSSLVGDALQEVSSIELSAANYEVAWKLLESRYENKKLIVKAHLDALFAVESLKKESYGGLNQLIGDFEKNLQMLERIGEKPSDWSTILAYIILC